MDFKILLEKLDSWTRMGKKGLVLEALKKIERNHLTLIETIEIAKIANRNHVYSLALKYLYKKKISFTENNDPLPHDLTTTYAAALLGVGAIEEAQQLLKVLKNHPQAVFSYALSFFSTWDYEKSIPLLRRYLKIQKDEYLLLVGRINIIAALIGLGDYKLGQDLLLDLQQDLLNNPKATILLGNTYEIQSQIDIENQNYRKALESLDKAKHIFQDQLTRYSLYVNKWQAVAELAISPQSKVHQQKLIAIKDQAVILKNWETLRDCDFQLGRFTKNQSLIEFNLYGSPYLGYRNRIEKLYGFKVDLKRPYIYKASPFQNKIEPYDNEKLLDLSQPPDELISHPNCLNLIRNLSRDFYRPSRLGVVHAKLFPHEYFNPFTSPQRVRNTILRTNELLRKVNTNFLVSVKSGDLFLLNQGIGTLKIFQNQTSFKKDLHLLNEIRMAMHGKSFNSKDIAKQLQISLRKAQDLIKLGVQKKIVKSSGKGKNTRYLLSNHRS